MYVSFYLLDDAQMRYHRLEFNGGPLSWNHYTQLIKIRLGLPLTDSPIGELALLWRDGSIDDFCARVMSLSCRDPAISKDHQIQLLLVGLGQHLRTNVALQKPVTLDGIVMYTRTYEQRDKFFAALTTTASRSTP
jgi:hypothetical protein